MLNPCWRFGGWNSWNPNSKKLGAQVAVTASAPKLETCKQLGADLAIDYKAQDFVDEVKNGAELKGKNRGRSDP